MICDESDCGLHFCFVVTVFLPRNKFILPTSIYNLSIYTIEQLYIFIFPKNTGSGKLKLNFKDQHIKEYYFIKNLNCTIIFQESTLIGIVLCLEHINVFENFNQSNLKISRHSVNLSIYVIPACRFS